MSKHSLLLAATIIVFWSAVAWADRVELLSGSKIEGKIVARDEQSITVEVVVGDRTLTRKYPTGRVHAVVVDGRRELLNEKEGGGKSASSGSSGSTESSPEGTAAPRRTGTAAESAGQARRTPAEIEALIDEQGRTAPDWWEATPLNYPKTLDLAWPDRPPPPWNSQRHINQYLWDIIYPNPSKWHEGIRFVHFLLTHHKDSPELQLRAMNTLGRVYFVLLQDYPRAAFWWRKAGVEKQDRFWSGVQLAECYWRLGNKQMAIDLLNRLDPQFSMIKLLGDMGETQKALGMAEANTRGEAADLAYLYAGDACRVAGQHQRALEFYEKVLTVAATGRAQKRIERNQNRARANIEAIKVFDLLDLARVPDGTYRGNSLGFEKQLYVSVTVKAGRIEAVRVTEHQEKQYYSAMTDTPRKIIAKQGVSGIHATSAATITSEAIINATAKALAGAMRRE